MPIFAYRCAACGHAFDALQKLGADPLTDCPECGASQLKKQLSAPAFHLKGKGWRNSDDQPKKMDIRPKYVHTFDSATPHAEHHDHHHGHSHDHGHSHTDQGHNPGDKAGSGNAKSKSGLGNLVRKHVDAGAHSHGHGHGHSHGHSHDHGHSHGPGSHTHGPGGHTHGPKAGLKAGKKPGNKPKGDQN